MADKLLSLANLFTWANLKSKPSVFPPDVHKSTHATAGSDAIAPADIGAATASALSAETTRAQGAEGTNATAISNHASLTTAAHGGIVASSDSRLTDARTPTAHAASHAAGGGDAISVTTTLIAAAAVTYAKIQNVATGVLLGRASAGAGVVEELTATQARTLLDIGYNPVPADHNLIGWLCDPMTVASSMAPTSGIIFLAKIALPQSKTINNILFSILTAGASLTSGQNFAALFDSSGNRIGVSADQSSNWAGTGIKTCALTSGVTVSAGFVWAALLFNATTIPTCHRPSNATALMNIGLSAAQSRTGQILSGQTSMPSSITPSSITASGATPWMALS